MPPFSPVNRPELAPPVDNSPLKELQKRDRYAPEGRFHALFAAATAMPRDRYAPSCG